MNPEILLRLIHDLTARAVDAEEQVERMRQHAIKLERDLEELKKDDDSAV